ncbi:MAG: RluA family pseudouridine synthase [Spirochaetaceae bacterium]|jgi:23S rRNA pseudouridine955/2504/2580 synthase|nr:RluA family pseudouridine synthase [Spirochaetaceae bacterium]
MKTVSIIYEDDEMLLVNKPFGVSVQGGEGVAHPLTEILEKQLGYRIYLVHRLDRDTSGLLLTAKTSQAAARLTGLISSSQVYKEYSAICFGIPAEERGVIREDVRSGGKRKSAVTEYRVLETGGYPREALSRKEFSHLSLRLCTGRTHQIRVHLAEMGCPIVADDKYGDFPANRDIRRLLNVRKLQLAAVRLTLPLYGKTHTFEVPLPDHMEPLCGVVFNTASD